MSVAFLLGLTLLSGCSKSSSTKSYPVGTVHETLGATTVKVMTFNIWIGGFVVDFTKVVEAIEISGADVVGL